VTTPRDRYLLDASAVLAVINRESGADRVHAVIGNSSISAVNLAEVASNLMERGYSSVDLHATLTPLSLIVVDFDRSQAIEAARLRPLTSQAGLSLGDRACLALAALRRLPVMTADRAWARLDLGIEIVVIR
jgi:PIN domain nuclease of toxin-antitoxin system